MKTFNRIATALVLMVAATGTTFAAGVKENYALALNITSIPDKTTVGSVDVPVTQAVRDWFQAHGVDGSKVDAPLGTLNQAYKDSIANLMADSDLRDSLQAVVTPALKAALVRGTTEVAVMRTGRTIFELSIDGPEDNDDN